MTRAEAVTFVKHLLFEDAATTGIASTANLNTTIDLANKSIWRKAISQQPSAFATRSTVSYVAANDGYDLSTSLKPYIIMRVEVNNGGSWLPVEPVAFNEQEDYDSTYNQPQGGYPSFYVVEGQTLRLLPRPATDQSVRLTVVPAYVALAADATELLSGKFTEFHDLVCYEAERILRAKDEAPDVFKPIRDEMKRDFMRFLGTRTTYRPHTISEVPFA